MESVLTAALEAVSLEPPLDELWGPVVADLVDAIAADDDVAFLTAVEAQTRELARTRRLRMADVFAAVRQGFIAFERAVVEASPGEAAEATERLRRLESDALVRAGVGFAEGLEDAVDHLSAEVDYLRPEDPLTGVMKESEIVRRFGVELQRCQRMELSLGLALMGVDCLDEVRRHGGPGEGGEFLRRVARLLGDSLRQYDGIGRRGEDGFLVVLPDVSRRGLQSVIERFRRDLTGECPSALHARFSFALAHLDFIDLSVDEALAQLERGLERARAGGDLIVWV